MRSSNITANVLIYSVALIALSGFTFKPALVPTDEIMSGGPPKDGIPSLTYPKMETTESAGIWLKPRDELIGVKINGQARAYPLRILNWHEVVNDRIGSRKVVITYCPLCGSGVAFDSEDQFGVSGLLYQSDVLLYDRKTESLWSQLTAQAITGPRMGERLKPIPIEHTTWEDWSRRHPETQVLSRHTGHQRDYGHDPYSSYRYSPETFFPVSNHDRRLHAKAWVIGLSINGKARAWDTAALKKAGELTENWNGRRLTVRYHAEGNRAEVLDAESGKSLNTTSLYWFAWAAFHPETELYY